MVDNYAAIFKCTPVGRTSDVPEVKSSISINHVGNHNLFVVPDDSLTSQRFITSY